MPYITQEKRNELDGAIEALHTCLVNLEIDDDENDMEGNLNYSITRLIMLVYGNKDNTRYRHINDAMGVLSSVKAEYYRKVAAPYENQKAYENGEVSIETDIDPVVVEPVEITPEAIEDLNRVVEENGLFSESALIRAADHVHERLRFFNEVTNQHNKDDYEDKK